MLGDTAIAVHPDDPRYQSLIGREVKHPQIQKGMNYAPGRWYYTVRLKTPDDVTDDVRGWLAEAWEFCS